MIDNDDNMKAGLLNHGRELMGEREDGLKWIDLAVLGAIEQGYEGLTREDCNQTMWLGEPVVYTLCKWKLNGVDVNDSLNRLEAAGRIASCWGGTGFVVVDSQEHERLLAERARKEAETARLFPEFCKP